MNSILSARYCLAVLLIVTLAGFAVPGRAADQPKIKVLLITGDDAAPAHNWAEMSAAVKETLLASGKFDVKVCEDAGILESAASLARYDLIFLQYYNAKTPAVSKTAIDNLVKFVQDGKGLTVSHLSSASFKEYPEFQKLCGRYWVMGKSGHNPRSIFKAHVANKDDAITRGLADFEADDELYAKLAGDEPINVLVEADSDFSKKTEPLAFTLTSGKGRVFHQTFGHDGKAFRNPSVQKLIQRGSEWAATGKVE